MELQCKNCDRWVEGKFLSGDTYEFICSCGYRWTASSRKLNFNFQDSDTLFTIRQRVANHEITSIEDCIFLLENCHVEDEQDNEFLSSSLMVLKYIRDNNSKSLIDNIFYNIRNHIKTILSNEEDSSFDAIRIDNYFLLFKTSFLFTEMKLLYSINEIDNFKLGEGLSYVSQIICIVLNVLENNNQSYIFKDKTLQKDQNYYRQKTNLLFSNAKSFATDDIVVKSKKDIYDILLNIIKCNSDCVSYMIEDEKLRAFFETYSEILYDNLKLPNPIKETPIKRTVKSEDFGSMFFLAIFYGLGIGFVPWIFYGIVHIWAYIGYILTFTLIRFQDTTGGWIDWYKGVWLYPTFILGGIAALVIIFSKLSDIFENRRLEKIYLRECEVAEEKYKRKLESVLDYNTNLKEKINKALFL